EALAEPGGIAISGTAYDHIKGKLAVVCDDLGPQSLKNLPEPVRVYRVRVEAAAALPEAGPTMSWRLPALAAGPAAGVMVAGLALWQPWSAAPPAVQQAQAPALAAAVPVPTVAAPAAAEPVIAVLAFDNLSGSPDQEYFSDGISEDIITALAQFPTLR